MEHKIEPNQDRCSECGCTGLEMRQETRLIEICDSDVLTEYRRRRYEFHNAMNAFFASAEDDSAPYEYRVYGGYETFSLSNAKFPWWENSVLEASMPHLEPETVPVSETAQRNIARAFK